VTSEELLAKAVATFSDRGKQYGDPEDMFDNISLVASIILNKNLKPYDIAMIFHCAKLCRTMTSRDNLDHYIDGINYLAFAGQFSDRE